MSKKLQLSIDALRYSVSLTHMKTKHSQVVLNLTGLRGMARKVLAQNVLKVLSRLGYAFTSDITRPGTGNQVRLDVIHHATFIGICLGCGRISFSTDATPIAMPPEVKFIDAATDYDAFLTLAREASHEALHEELKSTIDGLITHLEAYLAKTKTDKQSDTQN